MNNKRFHFVLITKMDIIWGGSELAEDRKSFSLAINIRVY